MILRAFLARKEVVVERIEIPKCLSGFVYSPKSRGGGFGLGSKR